MRMQGRNMFSWALLILTLDLSCSVVKAQLALQNPDVPSLPYLDRFKLPQDLLPASLRRAPLPTDVSPEHYRVFLRPVLGAQEQWPQFKCPGTVNILLNVHSPTNRIVLHRGATTEIHSASLIHVPTGSPVAITSQEFQPENQFQFFDLGSDLIANSQYDLFINFTSRVAPDSLSGLYLARYVDEITGVEKLAATTQFEEIGAREAFPNFDDPHLKATFSISIARTAQYNTLANSPLTATIADPNHSGWLIDSFNTTVKMSSYLVALVVSEFTCVAADPQIFDARPVQVCGPEHLISRGGGELAANASAHLLKLFENTFNFPYEQYKMDSVGIIDPYFGAGAMENWGLNIYREAYLMYYEGESLESQKRQVVSILGHELAHQWFGNVVTCKTWAGIWLNEGFASYVEKYFSGVTPEFDTDRERLWDHQGTLDFDVGVDVPINGSTTGQITYSKGATILRMVEGFMGKPLFLEALAAYLARFQYSPVEQDDLFAVLTEFARREDRIPASITAKDVMDTWTLQAGFPLLRVTALSDTSNQILISQTRCLPSQSLRSQVKEVSKALDPNDLWQVPIFISSTVHASLDQSNRSADVWLSSNSAISSMEIDTTSWSVFNSDGMGYFRVLYDDHLFGLIEAQLSEDFEVMTALTRSQLLDDYFNLNQLGHVAEDKPLRLTKYLLNETDHIVYSTVLNNLQGSISTLLTRYRAYQRYWLARLEHVIDHIGVENKVDRGSMVLFRARILDWANSLGSSSLREKASLLVEIWKLNPNAPITADYRAAIYCAAVADSANSQFAYFLQRYNSSSDVPVAERSRFFNALSCAQDPVDIQTLLQLTLNKSFMTDGEVSSTFQKLFANAEARTPALVFADENFDELVARTGGTGIINNIVSYHSASITINSEAYVLLAFVEYHSASLPNAEALTSQIINKVFANIDWMTANGNAMLDWYSDN